MRLLVVLALVAFTGCQANILWADEPKSQLEVVTDTFWDYIAKARQTAEDSLKSITESEFGQQVSTKIKDSVAVAGQYAAIAEDQVTIFGQETYKKFSEQVDRLSDSLRQDIDAAWARLEPYTEKVRENVEHRLKDLKSQLSDLWTSFSEED